MTKNADNNFKIRTKKDLIMRIKKFSLTRIRQKILTIRKEKF